MGTNRLTDLLAQSAEPIAAPHLAERAWAAAQRTRRRRVLVGTGLATAVAVAVGAVAVIAMPGGTQRAVAPDKTASAPTTGAPTTGDRTNRIVDTLPVRPQRQPVIGLPDRDLRPVTAIPLSRQVVGTAIALYQPYHLESDRPAPVYALRDNRTWYELDVVSLTHTRDADGNRAVPLRSTALSFDGRYAAIAQPDELVVVDLATAQVAKFPVPGFNEQVLWRGTHTVLVGQDAGLYAVDRINNKVTRTAAGFNAWDVIADPEGDDVWLELPAAPGNVTSNDPPLLLRRWLPDRAEPLTEGQLNRTDLAPYGVTNWLGRGWLNGPKGDLVVRGGYGHTANTFGIPVLGVVDIRTGTVVRLLPAEGEVYKAGVEPLGWLDVKTALVRIDPLGLFAWNIGTGEITLVIEGPLNGTLALRP